MIKSIGKFSAFVIASVMALTGAPAAAELGVDATFVELKKLESGSQKIESGEGYIFFHAPMRAIANFIKLPDEADEAEFRAEWEKEFAEAEKGYPRKYARWLSDVEVAKITRKAPPEQPVKPTRENFSIGNILFRNVVTAGPQYKFASNQDGLEYSYLTGVEPGTYIYYGGIMMNPIVGTCACMGTVKFQVKRGVVTDIGNLPALMGQSTELKFGLPSALSQYSSAQAEFLAHGKIDNQFGVRIGRVPPLDGVMRYERDHMIDLKIDPAQVAGANDDLNDLSGDPAVAEAQPEVPDAAD